MIDMIFYFNPVSKLLKFKTSLKTSEEKVGQSEDQIFQQNLISI